MKIYVNIGCPFSLTEYFKINYNVYSFIFILNYELLKIRYKNIKYYTPKSKIIYLCNNNFFVYIIIYLYLLCLIHINFRNGNFESIIFRNHFFKS